MLGEPLTFMSKCLIGGASIIFGANSKWPPIEKGIEEETVRTLATSEPILKRTTPPQPS